MAFSRAAQLVQVILPKKEDGASMSLKQRWNMFRQSVHYRLICLVLAGVLPVALAATYLIYTAYLAKQQNISQHMLKTTQTFSMIMDQELEGIRSSMQTLATSPLITSGDYIGFHSQIQKALFKYPDADIILADLMGNQLVNSSMPPGSSLPKRNVPDRTRSIVAAGNASISDLYKGAISGRFFISVDVPVVRDDHEVLDLAMTVPADDLLKPLSLSKLPPDWTATILDGNDVVVARTQDQERFVGKHAEMPVLAQHKNIAKEGMMEAFGLAGVPILVGYSQSGTSGWTIVISVPRAVIMRDLWQCDGRQLLLSISDN